MATKFVTCGRVKNNLIPSGYYSVMQVDGHCQANFEAYNDDDGNLTDFTYWFGGKEGTFFSPKDGDFIFN